MSEKHYCMDCIHCREGLDVGISSAPSYWCRLEDDLVENFGDRRLSKYKKKVLCSEKNADGTCPDFEDRKLPETPPPPPYIDPDLDPLVVDEDWNAPDLQATNYLNGKPLAPPPSISPMPPIKMIREPDFGPYCPKCGSSLKRKWWGLGRVLGCIQPECGNYYGRKT